MFMGVWFIGMCQNRNLGHGVVQYFVDRRHSAAVGGPTLGGLVTRASKGSSPAAGKEGTAARDIVVVGGGAKKGLTSDGGVYNVIT